MDDIIVIILTLIFIVASIFGQKKKRPPIPATETEPLPAEDYFRDLLEKQLDDTRQSGATPQQKPERQHSAANTEPQHYTFQAEKEGARTAAEKPEKPKKNFLKVKKKKFPLREAVIYSEILNRKYT